MRSLRRVVCSLITAAVVLSAPAALAKDDAADMSREGGLGVTSALATLVYGPLKVVYAFGGIIIGGCAWAFTGGDNEVAGTVFTRSVRGTYVITPEILLGEEPLEFIGREPQNSRRSSGAYADATASSGRSAVSSAPPANDPGW